MAHHAKRTRRVYFNVLISLRGDSATSGKKQSASGKRATISAFLEFRSLEYGRTAKVVASEEVKNDILNNIGINECARESGFDRKNFIRKLVRGIPVKRNSYDQFVGWLQS